MDAKSNGQLLYEAWHRARNHPQNNKAWAAIPAITQKMWESIADDYRPNPPPKPKATPQESSGEPGNVEHTAQESAEHSPPETTAVKP